MKCRCLINMSIACVVLSLNVSAQKQTEVEKERIADRKHQVNQLKRRHKALGGNGNIDAILLPLEIAALLNGNEKRVLFGVQITLEQAAVLSKKPFGRGGFTIGEDLLYELTCKPVYQARTQSVPGPGGTQFYTHYYNLLGMPIRETIHQSRFGFQPRASGRIELVEPAIWGNNTLTVRTRFEFVEPAVLSRILNNKKYKIILEKTGLQDQLVRSVNQLIVLNSTIENGQLVPMKPGLVVTPKRFMDFRVDEEGKITAKFGKLGKSDRQKLKDAHNNAGQFKDVKGVPVGAVLPPEN